MRGSDAGGEWGTTRLILEAGLFLTWIGCRWGDAKKFAFCDMPRAG
jgi:hypothetical protein